jgi:hypothetical protein
VLKTLVGVFMAEPTTSLQITEPRWPAASASKRFCISAARTNIGEYKRSSVLAPLDTTPSLYLSAKRRSETKPMPRTAAADPNDTKALGLMCVPQACAKAQTAPRLQFGEVMLTAKSGTEFRYKWGNRKSADVARIATHGRP